MHFWLASWVADCTAHGYAQRLQSKKYWTEALLPFFVFWQIEINQRLYFFANDKNILSWLQYLHNKLCSYNISRFVLHISTYTSGCSIFFEAFFQANNGCPKNILGKWLQSFLQLSLFVFFFLSCRLLTAMSGLSHWVKLEKYMV